MQGGTATPSTASWQIRRRLVGLHKTKATRRRQSTSTSESFLGRVFALCAGKAASRSVWQSRRRGERANRDEPAARRVELTTPGDALLSCKRPRTAPRLTCTRSLGRSDEVAVWHAQASEVGDDEVAGTNKATMQERLHGLQNVTAKVGQTCRADLEAVRGKPESGPLLRRARITASCKRSFPDNDVLQDDDY